MKKIISILICISMLMSPIMAFAANSDSAEVSSLESVDEQLLDSYKLLSRLGIVDFEESQLKGKNYVTTKDFAKMALGAHNIRTELVKGATVGGEMSYYGFEYGKSYSDFVSYKEAAKIGLRLVGYDAGFLNIKEADYSGWLKKANSLKLFAGVNAYSEEYVTYADAVNIFANLLELNLITSEGGYASGFIYTEKKGETVLTKYHDIGIVSGVVEGNENTSLYSGNAVGKKSVVINGEVFKTSYDESKYYLGYNVIAYYFTDGDDEGKIIYMSLNRGKNDVLRIDANDVVSYNNYVYKYEKNERSKEADIRGAAVIYNQKFLSSHQSLYMEPKDGEIILIDNNNDGYYDVVSISAYEESIIVKYITEADKYACDKYTYGKGVYLDEQRYDVLDIVDANANRLSLEQIKNGDVISVARSVDGKILTAVVGGEYVMGNLNQIDTEDGIRFQIGETYYKVTQSVYDRLIGEITFEGTYKCLIDYSGNIVDMTSTGTSAYKFAYLRDVYLDSDGITLVFKMFTEDGEFMMLEGAEKISVNGAQRVSYDQVLSLAWVDFSPQLIRYKINEEGKVNAVHLAEVTQNKSNMLTKVNSSLNSHSWVASQSSFEGVVPVSDGALVFTVPEAGQEGDKRFYMVNKGTKSLSGKLSYYAYKTRASDMRADVIVSVGSAAASAANGGNIMIVSKIKETVTSDVEPAYKVEGVTNNGEAQFLILKDDVQGTFDYEPGDIIRYTIYEGDRAYDIVKLFDYAPGAGIAYDQNSYTSPIVAPASSFYYTKNVSTMGYIIDTDGRFVKVNENKKSDTSYNQGSDLYFQVSGLPIYHFTSDTTQKERIKKIKEVNIPDASSGKNPYAYIYSIYESVKFIVVYDN